MTSCLPWRERPVLSIDETAELLSVGRKAVERMVANGELASRAIGARWLVVTGSLLTWLGESALQSAGEAPAVTLTTRAKRNARRLLQ